MPNIKFKLHFTPTTWFVGLTILAVILAIGLPPDPATIRSLHTSEMAFRLAITLLLVPYILIWYCSFYAFAKLREYALPLRLTKDGAAFYKISVGMGAIAFSLIVPTIFSLIINSIAAHQPSFHTAATIINNYLGLYPGLVSFLLLYNGARQLVGTIRGKARQLDLRWFAPWFILLGVTFSRLTIQNQYQTDAYHMNIWLLMVTFIMPYIYGWMVGLLCAYELHIYASAVKGLLYRRGVQQIANGIAVTILGSIAVQFVNSALAQRLNRSLGEVLLMDYGLLIIIAGGLVLIALGAKKLRRIEEI